MGFSKSAEVPEQGPFFGHDFQGKSGNATRNIQILDISILDIWILLEYPNFL